MRELKWQPRQMAELSVLGPGACTGTARILTISGKRVLIEPELSGGSALAGGAAIGLEWDGQLVLGEVLSSGSDGVWVEIQHMLLDGAGPRWQENGWRRG